MAARSLNTMQFTVCILYRSVCAFMCACVRLSVCTALVILDLAQDANVHIIQMIKNKGHIQLIPVFVAVLSGFALYSARTCMRVCAHAHACVLTWRLVCLHRFSYFGC